MKSGFFKVYTSFDEFRANNHYQVAAWADDDLDIMNKAVESYFHLQHGQKGGTSEIDFHYSSMSRPEDMRDTRSEILVTVQLHGEEYPTKYGVKYHHFGSRNFYPKTSFPDMREIFCYKLLELIEVGPAVQFILPGMLKDTETSTYIATKWRDDFIPLSDLKKEEDISVEALVQLLLLNTLFFIEDLHGERCGQWKDTKTAAIVDFIAGNPQIYPDVKKKLFDDSCVIHWDETNFDLGSKCCGEKCLEIVKKWLQDWDLLSKIDEAAALIKNEKDQMEMLENHFRRIEESKYTVTDDLNDYIHAVKSNVKNLTSALELSV
ncbi:hypothetical protein FO519_005753 [Halicephalobus sp. NKZ332]|nr:hypothetical protein FO519_005753 [Halicephalobus sp. NKZ332]